MKITTDEYDKLLKVDIDNFTQIIDPLSSFRGGEYGPIIQDYQKILAPTTNRFIEPYKTSIHGKQVYNGVEKLIDSVKPNAILDLGCGMGEFLYIASQFCNAELYGCTIHTGEVKAAKIEYNLTIIPADMRLIDKYFKPKSIDLIIANNSLHFLNAEDQQKVANAVHTILSDCGRYVIIHYKDPIHYTLRKPKGFYELLTMEGFIGPTYIHEKDDIYGE